MSSRSLAPLVSSNSDLPILAYIMVLLRFALTILTLNL
ncbi:hypothetical protein CKA32_003911 [Geitlerinema sp. FC II]|nr:hypothetical protein CKA32_003911 [Geitlerinema sp. FC II]